MDKLEIINEMTADDARLLPDAVRAAVLASVQHAPEVQLVTELRQALGADDKADLKALITSLREQQEAQAKAAVSRRITELVEDEETGIKVKELRGLVTELVTARKPGTVEAAETAYNEVIASEHVKAALAAHVQSTMGPRQRTPVQQTQNGKGKYFQVPQEDK